MPENPQQPVGQTGQPVPQVPIVPAVGQAESPLNRKRPNAAQRRQDVFDKLGQANKPIFRRIYSKTIQRGSLATFQYLFWKHDPYPLVLCSGIYQDGRVAGINLHYMTFKYMKYLIKQYCGKQFSYPLIKGNSYIYNAFRTYKRDGLRMTKLLDCDFLMTLLGTARSFKPTEAEAIRQEIQRQLRKRVNPTADEAMEEYSGIIIPDPYHTKYQDIAGYDPMQRYGEPDWPRAVPPLKQPKPTIGDARRNPTDVLPPPDIQ